MTDTEPSREAQIEAIVDAEVTRALKTLARV